MKNLTILIVVLLITGFIAAFFIYKYYISGMVAEAIVEEEKVPDYLPKHVQHKIKALRSPVNAGAEDVIKKMHQADIPIEKILSMIDNTTESQLDNIIEELNETPLKSTDQVFDIAKKHLSADFDIEVLRQPFNKNVNLKMVQKGIRFRKGNNNANAINMETAKTIAKQILIAKEKELQGR